MPFARAWQNPKRASSRPATNPASLCKEAVRRARDMRTRITAPTCCSLMHLARGGNAGGFAVLLFMLVFIGALPAAGAMRMTPGGIQMTPAPSPDTSAMPSSAMLSMMQRAAHVTFDEKARDRSPPPKRGDTAAGLA